jgi:hypothetical protein
VTTEELVHGVRLTCIRCDTTFRAGGVARIEPPDPPERPTRYSCPYCGDKSRPRTYQQTSRTGYYVFVLLLIFFFPLCWLGFFIREQRVRCRGCGIQLGRSGGWRDWPDYD